MALLDEYQRNRDALEKLHKAIKEMGERASLLERVTKEHHFIEFILECENLYNKALPGTELLSVMRYHYKIFGKLNVKKRLKAQARRQAEIDQQMDVNDLDLSGIKMNWREGLSPEEIAEKEAEDDAMARAWIREHKG